MALTAIAHCNEKAWAFLSHSLTPPHFQIPRGSAQWCFTLLSQTGRSLLSLPVVALTSSLAIAEKTLSIPLSVCSRKRSQDPNKNFSTVLHDSRQWANIQNIRQKLLSSPPGNANKNFLYGTASCTYQDSGYTHCPNSQWHLWEKKILPPNNQSRSSANLFALYQTDPQAVLSRLETLGVNSYRTSVEWSQIEPTPGTFDDAKLDVYVNFCTLLLQHGIEPMITLHHFSEPQWFHDKGSFERAENIQDFVKFSQHVYERLTQDVKGRPLVKYFCTINEPAIEAFSRFIRGAYSPGVHWNFHRASLFLKGALKAHCAVYKALKSLPVQDTKIGFTHQYLRFIPGNALVTPVTYYLSELINESTLNLFKTHIFSMQVPFACHVVEKFDPQELQTDFVGVQYYTRPFINLRGSVTSHTQEAMTAMPFREDPAGLYEALIRTYEACKKPLFVTENGISTHESQQRARYMQHALYALKEAEKTLGPGILQAYYQWCFTNNFEWDLGMHPQAFGVFEVIKQPDGTTILSDIPKKGLQEWIDVIHAWRQIHQPKQTVKIA